MKAILTFAILIAWRDTNPAGTTQWFKVWRAEKNCTAAKTYDFAPIAILSGSTLQFRDASPGRCYAVTSIVGGVESAFSNRATPN